MVKKCHFAVFEELPKWHFFTFACNVLWKCHYMILSKICLRRCPSTYPCLSKRKNEIISKSPRQNQKILFVWALYEFLDGMEHWIKSRYFFGHLKTCTDSVGCASCLQQKRVSNLWVWNFVSLGWLTKSNLPFLRDLSRWSILKNLNWKTSYFRHPK